MCPSAEEAAPAPTSIPEDRLRLLFALLFSSPEAVTLDRIRQVLYPAPAEGSTEETPAEHFSPRQHLEALELWLAARDLPLCLHQVGRSWRLLTSEDLADDLASARKTATKEKLGPASLEVLALVAYRQPVLKADIDAIRGVKSGSHLRHLLDLRLVKILGRAELPGRPFLYGTTKEFLDRFGLRDLEDLPEAGRLAAPAEQGVGIEPAAPAAAEATAKPKEAKAGGAEQTEEGSDKAKMADSEAVAESAEGAPAAKQESPAGAEASAVESAGLEPESPATESSTGK
ncbi:MAG: SMC-Scp complex subunit ScpB [Planctomycetes bacterium]|nr:SMC-Scp complex subunit ScpB [Planctomycetota bacterium]MCP4861587.1 SMC-Scp complex subunit ScpB [Planctomycetota bacterium]